MTCVRCQVLMVEDKFPDVESPYGQIAMSRRCLNCGYVSDSVIEQHRQAQQQNILVAPGGDRNSQNDDVHLGAESFIRRAA